MEVVHSNGEAVTHEDTSLSLRRCFGHFATGVAVVTYDGGDQPRGLTVNSFTSVSLDPPLVLVCLDKRSRAIPHLIGAPFGVNVLTAGQRDLAWHFAGKSVGAVPAWRNIGLVPLLDHSLAWMTCTPWSSHDAGDHLILVGKVDCFGSGQHDPLCFYRGQFAGMTQASAQGGERHVAARETESRTFLVD
jgi:flavin reductase (DIM6/NTAB) family NADH-FMN oxidoreductase RutF